MKTTIRSVTRHTDGTPGDHVVIDIQQLGEGTTSTDATNVIVDTDPEERDIRITDGETVVKIRLNDDYTVKDVLQDDVVIS